MQEKPIVELDVLFVVPPFFIFMDTEFPAFPSGLGYMVSYLKQRNINAQIYNGDKYQPLKNKQSPASRLANYLTKLFSGFSYFAKRYSSYYIKVNRPDNPIWGDFEIALKKTNPRIVGITCSVITIPSVVILAKRAKEVLPGVTVVVGGPAATTCSDELIKHDSIDFLVQGEGEETILELTSYILGRAGRQPDLSAIKGIKYIADGNEITTGSRPLIEDLDTLPFPDRDLMFVIDEQGELKYIQEPADILTSRGCPYPCKFCCAFVAWGTRRTRFRSVDNIMDELLYLKNTYGQCSFVFWDDLFTANKKRTMKLCQKIIDSKLDIEWVCLVRLNTLDAELMEIMKRAGCKELQIGIESGNDRVLKHIGKNLTLELIRKQIPIVRESGIDWGIFLIVGFPTETKEEIRDTMNLINELKPTKAYISIFSPYPGTEFYDDLAQKGLLGEDFMKSDFWYPYNNYTGTMTDKEYVKIGLEALKIGDSYNARLEQRFSKYMRLIKKHLPGTKV